MEKKIRFWNINEKIERAIISSNIENLKMLLLILVTMK